MTREEIEKRIMPLLIVVRVGDFGSYEKAIAGVVAIHNEAIEAAAHKADQRVWRTSGAPIAAAIRALKIGGA